MGAAAVETVDVSAWRLLSLLLDYPDERLLAVGEELRAAALELEPGSCREAILAFLERRAELSETDVQRGYVETFDFARRNTLYLSFHTYGDRRQRGMAMLHLKQIYRRAGLELSEGILPDHLPAVLEFTDTSPRRGVEILADFRPALEVIRAALHEEGSDYARLLDALVAQLPEVSSDDLEKARRIAAEGPPSEQVGLEPFGEQAGLEPFEPPVSMHPGACS